MLFIFCAALVVLLMMNFLVSFLCFFGILAIFPQIGTNTIIKACFYSFVYNKNE